jgi:hypothetical protein
VVNLRRRHEPSASAQEDEVAAALAAEFRLRGRRVPPHRVLTRLARLLVTEGGFDIADLPSQTILIGAAVLGYLAGKGPGR